MNRTTQRPLAAGLGAVIVGATAAVLAPTAAQAEEFPAEEYFVSSDYNVGCTLHPDQGYGSSDEPAGVRFDGERHHVTASPEQWLLAVDSRSVYPADATTTGEDCGADGNIRDYLTVGAGSSGLADGDEIQVQVTVRLDADLDQGWDDDGSFQTRAEYDAHFSITSLDDCTPGEEGEWCETPLGFSDDHRHYLYGGPADAWFPNGYVEAQAQRSYRFVTNAGTEIDEYVEEPYEICTSWPCDPDTHDVHDPQEAEVFTGTATLVVGSRYQISGGAGVFTQAYDNVDTWATAAVNQLSLAIDGPDGVELAYASDGTPAADTVAPEVTADVTPPAVGGWHTTAPTVTFSASDTGSGVASISYSSTGAQAADAIVVDGDTATVTVDTDGVTEVTFSATDVAGNVSAPQTLSVRLDTGAPVFAGITDLTVPATGPAGATVTFPLTATDGLGGPVTTVCTPASGSTFPVGTTPVTCTATDEAGNGATAGFAVTVTAVPTTSAMDRLGDAIAAARASGLVKFALTVAYRVADAQLDAGRTRPGCALLNALDVLVRASGRSIPAADAAAIRGLITQARAENGC
jgi:hypothetical protein